MSRQLVTCNNCNCGEREREQRMIMSRRRYSEEGLQKESGRTDCGRAESSISVSTPLETYSTESECAAVTGAGAGTAKKRSGSPRDGPGGSPGRAWSGQLEAER